MAWKPKVFRADNGLENVSGKPVGCAVKTTSILNISSRANPSRTLTLSDTAVPFATSSYPSITGKIWKKSDCSQPIGCSTAMITVPIWPWAALGGNSGWPWPLNSTSESPLKGD